MYQKKGKCYIYIAHNSYPFINLIPKVCTFSMHLTLKINHAIIYIYIYKNYVLNAPILNLYDGNERKNRMLNAKQRIHDELTNRVALHVLILYQWEEL